LLFLPQKSKKKNAAGPETYGIFHPYNFTYESEIRASAHELD